MVPSLPLNKTVNIVDPFLQGPDLEVLRLLVYRHEPKDSIRCILRIKYKGSAGSIILRRIRIPHSVLLQTLRIDESNHGSDSSHV